jgi:membrane dipeptidase
MLNLGRCRLGAGEPAVSTRAVDLVGRSPVVDMLGFLTLDWARLYRWERTPASFAEADFWRLGRSGVNILHPAVETPGRDRPAAARRWLELWRTLLTGRPCFLAPVETVGDLYAIPGLGKIGVVVGFQNSDHFRTAADVETCYRLGQRVSQLTYDEGNRLGGGCRSHRDGGLTAFGAEVVAEMDRVGMAIDVSHCGERTTLDAIRLSRKPVLVTHSNCRALVPDQPRCKSDRVIRELARHGGVMGVTVVRAFVGRRSPAVEHVLDHFDHIARLAGIEHAGLGSDVDFEGADPKTGGRRNYAIDGLCLPLRVFQLADGLLRRGYGEAEVELVLGRNFQRALADVWSGDPWWPPAEPPRRDPFCPAPIRGPAPPDTASEEVP